MDPRPQQCFRCGRVPHPHPNQCPAECAISSDDCSAARVFPLSGESGMKAESSALNPSASPYQPQQNWEIVDCSAEGKLPMNVCTINDDNGMAIPESSHCDLEAENAIYCGDESVAPVNVAATDITPAETQHTHTNEDRYAIAISLPDITAQDYVTDEEFQDMYRFLVNDELMQNERRDRVTLLFSL